jgi:hypothetical protein
MSGRLERALQVAEALTEVRGKLAIGPTKTRNTRKVTLPPFLVE